MLAGQGRRQLAGVEIGKIEHLCGSKAKGVLHLRLDHHGTNRMHCPAHHRGGFDLHTGTAAAAYQPREDRKSTRLNSSHVAISYAVFCLKKKKIKIEKTTHNIVYT